MKTKYYLVIPFVLNEILLDHYFLETEQTDIKNKKKL